MKIKIWLVIFSFIVLIALLYLDVEFIIGGEAIATPRIVIVVKSSNYEIDGRKGGDLLSLISEAYIKGDFESPPNIIVSADSSVQYERVVETMATLKNNGYTKVGLANTN